MLRVALSILCTLCAFVASSCTTHTAVGPNGETVFHHTGRNVSKRAEQVANDAGRNNTNSRALDAGATVVEYDDQGRVVKMQYDPEARALGPNQLGGYSGGYARFGTGIGHGIGDIRGPLPQTGWVRNARGYAVNLVIDGRPYGILRPNEVRVIKLQPGSHLIQAFNAPDNALVWERTKNIDEVHGDSAPINGFRKDWNHTITNTDADK